MRSAGSDTYNYVNPIQRDTVSAGTTGDNMTIRFQTDNTGPWFLHCHIDFHLDNGLAVVFAEDTGDVSADISPSSEYPILLHHARAANTDDAHSRVGGPLPDLQRCLHPVSDGTELEHSYLAPLPTTGLGARRGRPGASCDGLMHTTVPFASPLLSPLAGLDWMGRHWTDGQIGYDRIGYLRIISIPTPFTYLPLPRK